jgi:UDP-glucose 4,6-dehydratase
MKILLLGYRGYVGNKFFIFLKRKDLEVFPLSRENFNLLDENKLYNVVKNVNPDFIINCAGYTGKPNVDACESNKQACWHGNVTLPKIISKICNSLKIKYIQLSSGCIYSGSKNGQGFTEEDPPNFCFDKPPSSYYSGTKAVAEDILIKDPYAYICRLRIPFNNEKDQKNYITKLLNYDILLNAQNSLSNIDEFIEACFYLLEKNCDTGIYNITNSGWIDTKQITSMLNEYKTKKQFKFFENENDFYSKVAITPRSNCILDNSKLIKTGYKMKGIKDSLLESIKKY